MTTPSTKGHLRPDDRAPVSRIVPALYVQPLVRWYWVPEWHLPEGQMHETLVLPYPACQLVVEKGRLHAYGPVSRRWTRELSGHGWAVGALLRPGAAHALVGDVSQLVDQRLELHDGDLVGAVTAAMRDGEHRHENAAQLLGEWLYAGIGEVVARDPDAGRAREMVERIDADPAIRDVADVVRCTGLPERSLHRLARAYVGMSPAAMIRRRRLQEAAQRVRDEDVDLACIAAELGYADHAHLTRDFRRILGFTPSDYRRS